jgi:signal transduction histidine kinase
MLEFTKQGSNRPAEEAGDYRSMILESEKLMPSESSIKVLEFANHVATAADAKLKTDQYLGKLLNSSADDQIGEISAAWNLWQSQENNTQEILSYYIIAYVLTMLGLIGILIFRLRTAYTSLDRDVEAKTQEIKNAYEELQSSERQLVQSEKMASLGQLVAGVAHEINTPLSYITSNIETIKARYENLVPVLQKADEISEHIADPNRPNSEINGILKQQIVAYRNVGKSNNPENMNSLIDDASAGLIEIKDIVDSLTNFSHVQDAPQQPVDVNERINSCLKVSALTLGDRKQNLDLATDIPMVQGVPNQLAQVFTNVINNAAHATDASSGELYIKTQAVEGFVEISFKDNGNGIDEESLKSVFEPFFTTKEVGEGTGLGLSISHRIIVAHDGEMEIKSAVGVGTSVVVRLPVASS